MQYEEYDAIVVGGGFYGCNIALHLKQRYRLARILIIEQGTDLLTHASYNNQARVHNGYHYPRSLITAYRSRVNFPHFVNDYADAIESDFTKLYCIARQNSKITAYQFERFCKEIEVEYHPAPKEINKLFNNRLIEKVFQVKEYAFNADIIREKLQQKLFEAEIEVALRTKAIEVYYSSVKTSKKLLTLVASQVGSKERISLQTKLMFNCTYSGLNNIAGEGFKIRAILKHEITEMALIQLPEELAQYGITVMDGPFFSVMPFPAKDLHTLSHVRYTPHYNWVEEQGEKTLDNPYQVLLNYPKVSRFGHMLRDVSRYLPGLKAAEYRESLFEVKTILMNNEANDGRPILFEQYEQFPGCYAVLGGKIDNIYDILNFCDNYDFINLS